jgi:hypothetical protein
MIPTIEILVLLLAVVAAVAVLASLLHVPSAIILVLTGVALALVPGLPDVELAPELVLLLVLPPVIYSSAVTMSWREFRFNLRPIRPVGLRLPAVTPPPAIRSGSGNIARRAVVAVQFAATTTAAGTPVLRPFGDRR